MHACETVQYRPYIGIAEPLTCTVGIVGLAVNPAIADDQLETINHASAINCSHCREGPATTCIHLSRPRNQQMTNGKLIFLQKKLISSTGEPCLVIITCMENGVLYGRTAFALVFDAGDDAGLAPIDSVGDGEGQVVVVVAGTLVVPGFFCRVVAAATLEAEDAATELLLGEVGEGVEAEAEAVEP